MTTEIALPTAFNPRAIQQELYQKVYDIHGAGPNNFDLGVGLCYSADESIHAVRFGIVRDDEINSWIPVFLTGLKCIDTRFERENWEFEGILWSRTLHAKQDGSTTVRAGVKGIYNSHKRTGKLYVLAHEQPKPLVEIISWEELSTKLDKMANGARGMLEVKDSVTGLLYRGNISSASFSDGRIAITFWHSLYPDPSGGWKRGEEGGCFGGVVHTASYPVVLADEKIVFSLMDKDCTVYPWQYRP